MSIAISYLVFMFLFTALALTLYFGLQAIQLI